MKTINIHNYEEFAIDYMVNRLSAQEAEAFTAFLAQHPDIADEILLFEMHTPIFEQETVSFNELKKNINSQPITEDNFEEYCIAAMEGDLNTDGTTHLNIYIDNNEQRQNTKALYAKSRLEPEIIVYPNKENLKKAVRQPLFHTHFINISAVIAAASIIAFSFFFTTGTKNDNTLETDKTLANSTEVTIDTPTQTLKSTNTPILLKQLTVQTEKKTISHPIKENPLKIQDEAQPLNQKSAPTIEAKNNTHEISPKLKFKKSSLPEHNIAMISIPLAEPSSVIPLEENTKTLRSATSKLLFTKVFAQSVEKLNKMAETELEYNIIEDKNGNPVRVIITSRFGEINKSLAQR